MKSAVLLDTCALIWLAEGEPIAPAAREAIDELWSDGLPPRLSPISALEIGMLVSRGRLSLAMSTERWWALAVSRLKLEIAPLDPESLIRASALPGEPPRDPADRILVSTARDHGLQIMTRDRLILDYAGVGHVQAVAC